MQLRYDHNVVLDSNLVLMDMKLNPTVLHLRETYLPLSETFIYAYLQRLQHWTSIVVARQLENQHLFAMQNVRLIQIGVVGNTFDRVTGHYFDRWPVWESRLTAVLRETKARVLHAHFGPAGVLAVRVANCHRIPLVTTFYGADMSEFARHHVWRKRYAYLFRHGDLFLVEGPHMRQQLVNLGCPAPKIMLQRIAIDVQSIRLLKKQRNEDMPIMLSCGRLVEKKGFEYAIRAMAHVVRHIPAAEYHIIGDGPLRPHLEDLVKELGLAANVHLLGSMTHQQYLEYARQASIFLAPSVTAANGDSEGGAPTTLLEMQAMAIPIVATRHADIPYVVRPTESALLVEERDAGALAQALLHLLAHPEQWSMIGAAGREHVERFHSIRLEAVRLETDVYDALAAGVDRS